MYVIFHQRFGFVACCLASFVLWATSCAGSDTASIQNPQPPAATTGPETSVLANTHPKGPEPAPIEPAPELAAQPSDLPEPDGDGVAVAPASQPTQPAPPIPGQLSPMHAARQLTPAQAYNTYIRQSVAAMRRNDYRLALQRSEDALRIRPGDSRAATIAGLAACQLKDAALARKYYHQVSARRQPFIRQICLRSGINLFP